MESPNRLEECNVELFLPSGNTACQEPEMPKKTSVREPHARGTIEDVVNVVIVEKDGQHFLMDGKTSNAKKIKVPARMKKKVFTTDYILGCFTLWWPPPLQLSHLLVQPKRK